MKNKILSVLIAIFLFAANYFAQDVSNSRDNLSSMLGANSISVTVGGNFIVNGSFPASPMERVDQFVTRIFNLYAAQQLTAVNDMAYNFKINQELRNIARRNIKLKRFSGEELTLDLEKYRLTGDFKNNPYLKNDDVLIFPAVDLKRNFIEIKGAVNNPVKFQFVEGDRLSDALLFARGINQAYENVEQAEINRLSYDGTKSEIIKIPVNSDAELKPGDRINIAAKEPLRKDFRVLVIGEVENPGYVFVTKNNTTIEEAINNAGGFKENADVSKIELVRDVKAKYEAENEFNKNRFVNPENLISEIREIEMLSMLRNSYIYPEDTTYFNIDNTLRVLRNTTSIDLANNSSNNDKEILLKDGDVLIVPEKAKAIYVFGQAATTGFINFEEGKDVKFYVEKAGGLTKSAKDFEDIMVIKGKTKTWVSVKDKDLKLEAGDNIWVPKETPRTFGYYFDYYLGRVGSVASIVGTVVTIILLTRD